jgi:hypothetical protein
MFNFCLLELAIPLHAHFNATFDENVCKPKVVAERIFASHRAHHSCLSHVSKEV